MSENKIKKNDAHGGKFGKGIMKVWHAFSHNWVSKVVCLLLAILLWGFIYSQDDALTREKVFENVKVQVLDSALTSLKNRGYMITSGLEKDILIRVTMEAQQKLYDEATEERFSVRPDFTKIKGTGSVTVPLVYDSEKNNFGDVVLSPAEITVHVEEFYSKENVAVSVVQTGEVPEGYRAGEVKAAKLEYSRLTVSGPRSLVQKIVRADALLDLTVLGEGAGTYTLRVPVVFRDREGNEIPSDHLTYTVSGQSRLMDGLNVTQTIYREWQLPVEKNGYTVGTPMDGYQVSDVIVNPATVLVLSDTDEISADRVFLDGRIDVTDANRNLIRWLAFETNDEFARLIPQRAAVTVMVEPVSAPDAAADGEENASSGQEEGAQEAALTKEGEP